MTPTCKHGHPWTEANTAWRPRPGGKKFRVCRRCQAEQSTARYRSDPAFREREKRRAAENYRRKVYEAVGCPT